MIHDKMSSMKRAKKKKKWMRDALCLKVEYSDSIERILNQRWRKVGKFSGAEIEARTDYICKDNQWQNNLLGAAS